ncbi:methyltransferase domain-containing protein [Nocardia sp. NPDC051990]|uniref:class I SAM-dependent methyltransferase n=1 Tax=Nocardia sp. NPDC051990 TaxID=3155285 RepID=UPI0034379F74
MTTAYRPGFLREFLRAPLTVAAIAPSSASLAAAVTSPIPMEGSPTVLELGPGTGSFTVAIQRRLAGRGHHLAIEINERFADALATEFPQVTVATGDARELKAIMRANGRHEADVIISGLPWAAFTPDRQDSLLDAVVDGLTTSGVFTTFAYTSTQWTPPARRLRQSLSDRFEEVLPCRTVWANLPPAFIYFCRRPRSHRPARREPVTAIPTPGFDDHYAAGVFRRFRTASRLGAVPNMRRYSRLNCEGLS